MVFAKGLQRTVCGRCEKSNQRTDRAEPFASVNHAVRDGVSILDDERGTSTGLPPLRPPRMIVQVAAGPASGERIENVDGRQRLLRCGVRVLEYLGSRRFDPYRVGDRHDVE